MSCKYNNCKICGYKSECEIYKENAELKKELEITRRCWYDQKNISLDTNCKLHKAKEIIKKFLLWENDWHNKTESKYELLKEAEQFLNSEVEK